MKDDDTIEVVDLSPDGSFTESIKDFIEEQMAYLDSLVGAALQSKTDEAPVEALAAYVRGANAASEEAIAEAWPGLRDDGMLSSEARRKVNMTGALCGLMIPKAQELMGSSETDTRAIGLLIMMHIQRGALLSSASIAKAVTLRATADELLERARQDDA